MRHSIRVSALLLTFTACRDVQTDVVIHAELGEVCGVEGPMRLLELPPDQVINGLPRRIGDRIFYDTGRPTSDYLHPTIDRKHRQLWTTGPCGETPTRLDEQFERVFEVEHWPGLALACDHSGNILSLAPTGPLAPHEVFRETGCDPVWSSRGPVTMRSKVLLLHPYPDDPRSSETAPWLPLLQGVATNRGVPSIAAADDLFALTIDRELVRVDLRGGPATVEQTGVTAFSLSPSRRYFALVVVLPPEGDQLPSRFAILHDRETGLGVPLGALGSTADFPVLWIEQDYLLFLSIGEKVQIFHLPDLEFVTVPTKYSLVSAGRHGPLSDGRWVLRSEHAESYNTLHYLDPLTGTTTPMTSKPAQVLAQPLGGALVFGINQYASSNTEAPLWFFPNDGSGPERIAERSTLFGWRPRPDLVATLLDIDSDWLGKLMLVPTATQEEQLVDDHVHAAYLADASAPDVITYSVLEGARSGVYQVRLRP